MDYPREGQNEVLSWVVSIFPRCFTVHSESAVVGGHTQDPEPVSLGFHKVTVSCTGRSTWTLKSGQTRPRREPPPPCHARAPPSLPSLCKASSSEAVVAVSVADEAQPLRLQRAKLWQDDALVSSAPSSLGRMH